MADETPIVAESADGIRHEFPAGTDMSVIDRVMKTYAMENEQTKKEPGWNPEPEPKPESRGTWGSDIKGGFYGTSQAMATTSAVRADQEIESLKKKIELFEKGDDQNVDSRFRNSRGRLEQVPGLKRQLAEAEKRYASTTAESAKDAKALMALPVNEPMQRFTEGDLGELVKNPGAVARGLIGQSLTSMVPLIVGTAVGGPLGGAVAGGSVGIATGGGQEAVRILQKHGVDATDAEAVRKALTDPTIKAEIDEGFGTAQAIDTGVGVATGGLGGVTLGAKTAVGAVGKNVGLQAVGQGGLSASGEAAKQGIIEGEMHPGKIAAAGLGEALFAPADAAAAAFHARSPKTPTETVKPVLDAPDVDTAIARAQEIINRPAVEGTAVDAGAMAEAARMMGDTTQQQQATLTQTFAGSELGSPIVAKDGSIHLIKEPPQQGTGLGVPDGRRSIPLKVWDETAPAVDGAPTMPVEQAAVIRDHYSKAAIEVIFYEDHPSLPDGVWHSPNPNTILLSNNPQRNPGLVAAHETTHAMGRMKLPDGTSLDNFVVDYIEKNVTGEGVDHALKMFGEEAPNRADFPRTPAGDRAHADAVRQHLFGELGADIGGEAPKFQTFMTKVIDAVEAKYGTRAATDVLRKLIDSIRETMTSLRKMFGPGDTVSQRWVTNLEPLHDTFAKMEAERRVAQVEQERARVEAMRPKAEPAVAEQIATPLPEAKTAPPDAGAVPEAPAAPATPEVPQRLAPAPAAGYGEAADRAQRLERWIEDLDTKRREDAAASPQARLLQQTEASILGKVKGREKYLTKAAAARLATVRGQLDALLNPAGDSADMAQVRTALDAERARLADAAAVGTGPAPGTARAGKGSDLPPLSPAGDVAPRGRAVMPEPAAAQTAPEIVSTTEVQKPSPPADVVTPSVQTPAAVDGPTAEPVAARAPVEAPAADRSLQAFDKLRDAERPDPSPPAEWQPTGEELSQARRVARGWTPETELRRPQSLTDFVRKNGGLRLDTPEAAEMLASDIGQQPGLLRRQGVQADWMARRAADNGYRLSGETRFGEGGDTDAFVRALIDDANDRQKVYPDDQHTDAWRQQQDHFIEFHNYLEDIGLKPKDMDPRQLAWILRQDPETARMLALSERYDSLGKDASLELAWRLDNERAKAEADAMPEPGAYEMADHRDLPAPVRAELEKFYDDIQRTAEPDRAGEPITEAGIAAEDAAQGGRPATARPEGPDAAQEIPAVGSARDAPIEGDRLEPLFSPKQVGTPAFKEWFRTSKITDDEGKPAVLYRGDFRDIGNKLKVNKTTSARFYFTDDPAVASNYATGKAYDDGRGDNFSDWFRFPPPKGSRTPLNLERLWYSLDAEQRAKVEDTLLRAHENEDGDGMVFDAERTGGLAPVDHWQREVREARGNWLAAAKSVWLESGALYGREGEFMKVLEHAGIKGEFDNPHEGRPVVTPVYLSIHRPVETSRIDKAFIDTVAAEVKGDRTRAQQYAGNWDKVGVTARDWFRNLKEDFDKKATDGSAADLSDSHVWTAVPEKITKILQRMGYDGIDDRGGKAAGPAGLTGGNHRVVIAFEPNQVKSAIGNRGTFDPAKDDIRFSPKTKSEEPFYSALTRGVEGLKLDKATPGQWEATVKNMPGVKAEERAWVGLDDWLKTQPKSVTKADVLDYLRANEVKVEEVTKREGGDDAEVRAFHDISQDMWDTLKDRERAELRSEFMADAAYEPVGDVKFASYVLPGGSNYRELLLTLPPRDGDEYLALSDAHRARADAVATYKRLIEELGQGDPRTKVARDEWMQAARTADEAQEKVNNLPKQFTGSHWDEPNVLAHIRFDDRTGPNGERVLHVAEIQSDWHQKGRKQGYREENEARLAALVKEREELKAEHARAPNAEAASELTDRLNVIHDNIYDLGKGDVGVPAAPFKTTWPELAFKRMLRYAAENGYDRVSWDTGETNAARYDLSKQVDHIDYAKDGENTWTISVRKSDGPRHFQELLRREGQTLDQIGEIVGKDVADRIQRNVGRESGVPEGAGRLEGLDLKVGGEGMVAFYDKQLPIIANKLGKKFGAKVEQTNISGEAENYGPLKVSSDGKRYWVSSDTNGKVSDYFDTAIAAMDARDAMKNGPAAHSILITPAMREGVMQGQTLFSPKTKTDTPEFKRWFGDSKVVDEEGKPLVVYHGSTENVAEFKAPAFFTPDARETEFYSLQRSGDDGGQTYPVYLSIKNPFDIRDMEGSFDFAELVKRAGVDIKMDDGGPHGGWTFESPDIRKHSPYDGTNFNDLIYIPAVREQMKKEGYDGLRAWDAMSNYEIPIWIALDPGQIKSATGNTGAFDPSNPDIRFSPKITHTPEQKKTIERVFAGEKPGFVEQLQAAREDGRRKAIYNTLDRYIGLKDEQPENYVAARMANSTAPAQAGFLELGTLKFDGDTFAMKDRNGGVQDYVARPLHNAAGDFIKWIAGNRAEKLAREGRENLMSAEDIKNLKSLNQGTLDFDYTLTNGKTTRSKEAAFLDSLKKYHEFNSNVIDLNVEAGNISKKLGDELKADPFYVPFYRVPDDAGRDFVGPSLASGLTKQTAFKKLEGGTEKLNADLWENAISNWSHMIDAALRNKTAAQIADTTVKMGAARELTTQQFDAMSKQEKDTTTWVMRDGEKVHYAFDDAMTLKAVSALDTIPPGGIIMDTGRWFARTLRAGVTANPLFALRMAVRDTQNTLATAHVSNNPIKNLADGFAQHDLGGALKNLGLALAGKELQAMKLDPAAADAFVGGGLMRLGSGQEGGIRRTTAANILDSTDKVGEFWHRISNAARAYKEVTAVGEDVNRLAVYKQAREAGASHTMASFAARDLQDFTLKGAAQWVRVLTDLTPFLNARAQGLYKLGRVAADSDSSIMAAVGGKMAKSLTMKAAYVIGAMAVADLALKAIYSDDEDYKKRTEDDLNMNWWFKVGDTQFRIPKGFEMAAISRLLSSGIEVFTDPEMTGQRWTKNLWSILGQNLQVQLPAIAQPIYEIATNENRMGAPITPRGVEDLRAEQQYTQNTTLISRGVSSAANMITRGLGLGETLSPIQMDHLVQGYGGWAAATVLASADWVTRSMSSEPDKPAGDLLAKWTQGMVRNDPNPSSRYINLLYTQGKEVEKAYAGYRDLMQRGRAAEAKEFFEDNKELIQKHGIVSATMRLESSLNKQIRLIANNPDSAVTAEMKRIQIMQLQAIKNRAAAQAMGVRP